MSKFPGSGLARGLAVTGRTLTKQTVTREYPDVEPDLPPRSRGVIGLLEENCTSCMLCARECPDWCIYIDSHKETLPAATEGGRARTRNVLDRFAIDYALCMYCGICIEVCPFDALFWSPEFEYAEHDILGLTHEREELREWMWTVPPPPATDRGAEPPKELLTATAGPSPVTRVRREAAGDAAAVPADLPAEPGERPAATPPSEIEGSGPASGGADDAG
jgi:NADH-quinone oxidoreductase subunit I